MVILFKYFTGSFAIYNKRDRKLNIQKLLNLFRNIAQPVDSCAASALALALAPTFLPRYFHGFIN
jgi:hypothetical protein